MEPANHWHPRIERPPLTYPVRIDPSGQIGPTRGQAQGRRWRSSTRGWYVPIDTDSSVVEQRILEQGARLIGSYAALTAWASLRWRGAAYFDGLDFGEILPVPILRSSGGDISDRTHAWISREQLPPGEIEVVAGVPCTSVGRALFDEIRREGELRRAVLALDMALAAGLITLADLEAYVAQRGSWTGVQLARDALALGSELSRSPQETRMRLVWVLDAGHPPPLVNRPVFDVRGNLLGIPDLLDLEVGVVGEYDGVDHKSADRHQRDVAREQGYRDHGLEYFTVVSGDLRHRAMCVERMTAARRRARPVAVRERAWTIEPPDWWLRRSPNFQYSATPRMN